MSIHQIKGRMAISRTIRKIIFKKWVKKSSKVSGEGVCVEVRGNHGKIVLNEAKENVQKGRHGIKHG